MSIRKYLIIAPSWVGDMVMSQSLYKLLKQKHPNCQIDVIAPKSSFNLLKFMPEVNRIISADFKHGEFGLSTRHSFGKQLRQKTYTHAIILPNSWKSALIPFFAKISKRTGWKGEFRYFLLNDLRYLDKQKYPLMIERFCALAKNKRTKLKHPLPYPKFEISPKLKTEVINKFHLTNILNHGIKKDKIVVIAPGAEFGPAKKWPSKHYAVLAQELINQNFQIWILGGNADQKTGTDILNQLGSTSNCIDFTGKTSLDEAIALLSFTFAVISNDSGLMHIANALNRKTLVIYGSSSDKFTPPLSKNATSIYHTNLSCRPCFKRECPLKHLDCLYTLTPDMVLAKFQHLIK